MNRILHCFLLAALLATGACTESKDIGGGSELTVEVSSERVVLPGQELGSAVLTVDAPAPWIAEVTEGSGFTLTPSEGGTGETKVTVTAAANNAHRDRITLGKVNFRLTAGNARGTEVRILQSSGTAAQTLLVYLAGRGNLVSAFERNIVNMLRGIDEDTPGEGRILVFRQTGTASAEIIELFYDRLTAMTARIGLKEYDETLKTTDRATMTRILNDMLALAPAESYGLILGSHGTAWAPYSTLTSFACGADGEPIPHPYWQKTEGVPQTRGFGADNGATMAIPELAEALDAADARFDYLVFDACFMSSIETLYDLRNSTDYIVGSPCEVMIYGYPYDLSIPTLFRNNGREHDLEALCRSFCDFYSTTHLTEQSGCIAMADCAQLEALAEVVRRINGTALRDYDSEALQVYEGLRPHLFYDLGDFIRTVCADEALLAEFEKQFDLTFPPAARLHTPSFYTGYGGVHMPVERYSGVSVSAPSTQYTEENRRTAWYRAVHE